MFAWETIWGFVSPLVIMVLIMLAGHVLIKYAMKFVNKALGRSKLDPSLLKYCSRAVTVVLHVFVVLAALDSVGVSTGGIVAAMSAAVVAVGVALKDSLGNVAGGIWLLFSPRFSTGDYIASNGDEGTVISVELLHTTLQTVDAKQVSIPNGVLVNSHIVNFSRENRRRVDILFPIPYETDVNKAKKLALDTLSGHPLVLNEPEEPFVRVRSYEASAVQLLMRVWCRNEDYWTVFYDLMESVRVAFENNGISIPYNQLDIRIRGGRNRQEEDNE